VGSSTAGTHGLLPCVFRRHEIRRNEIMYECNGHEQCSRRAVVRSAHGYCSCPSSPSRARLSLRNWTGGTSTALLTTLLESQSGPSEWCRRLRESSLLQAMLPVAPCTHVPARRRSRISRRAHFVGMVSVHLSFLHLFHPRASTQGNVPLTTSSSGTGSTRVPTTHHEPFIGYSDVGLDASHA